MKKVSDLVFSSYLEKGEKILNIARSHLLVYKIKASKVSFFGIILPIFGYIIFPQFLLAFVLWLLVGLSGIFYHMTNWYYDAWLITNKGVIDIKRDGFFDVSSTRVDYHLIDDVSYTRKGLLQTVFNYGDITIDKVSAGGICVTLKDAASPNILERKLLKYQTIYMKDKSIKDHNELKSMLAQMIATHMKNEKAK